MIATKSMPTDGDCGTIGGDEGFETRHRNHHIKSSSSTARSDYSTQPNVHHARAHSVPSSNAHMLTLTIDTQGYLSKPHGKVIGNITRRLQRAGHSVVTLDTFARQVSEGHSWCGGCFEASDNGWGAFFGQRVFAVDFDHDPNGDGQAPSPSTTLAIASEAGLLVLMWYPTFNATKTPWNPRHRIVFDAGETLCDRDAKDFDRMLADVFRGYADKACFNRHHNRIMFGSNHPARVLGREGERWESTGPTTSNLNALRSYQSKGDGQRVFTTRTPIGSFSSRDRSLGDIAEVMMSIPCGSLPYSDWIRVGMGAHASGVDYEIWDEWCRTDPERYDRTANLAKWNAFNADGGIGSGTVVHIARRYGSYDQHRLDSPNPTKPMPERSL